MSTGNIFEVYRALSRNARQAIDQRTPRWTATTVGAIAEYILNDKFRHVVLLEEGINHDLHRLYLAPNGVAYISDLPIDIFVGVGKGLEEAIETANAFLIPHGKQFKNLIRFTPTDAAAWNDPFLKAEETTSALQHLATVMYAAQRFTLNSEVIGNSVIYSLSKAGQENVGEHTNRWVSLRPGAQPLQMEAQFYGSSLQARYNVGIVDVAQRAKMVWDYLAEGLHPSHNCESVT